MVKSNKIYLDYAASALSLQANPGAIHDLGTTEKNKLENARTIIAKILYARNDEIIFTSGATESNNLAILGLVQNFKKPHIITTNIEHASVLEVFRHLEKTKQAEVTFVEVEKNGIVDVKKIKKSLKPNTVLISVMYANNEIGTIQPIGEIAKEIRHFNKIKTTKIFFHADATQAVNYLPINVLKLGVDLLSFNGAKIYGPKGIGILYIKKNTPVKKIMFGGDQEFGLRPGTENVALAVGLAKALQVVDKIKNKEVFRLTKLRDYFISSLIRANKRIVLNGDLENRLPNNVNITIPKIPSDLLVIELSAKGIMASSKSACKSSKAEGSYVIKVLRKEADSEIGGLRFSLGRDTTKKDIDYTVKTLSQILTKLKKWY
ncbi:MAG: Cysteine desulfurase [Candidatus Nomurabacteria bacterium GW2011_GWB1_43_7]|uniref:Cysteine desulfurase n=1 Tax=Candidatus Nomurabacteria bacterium GW2011_GWB1_43_7 TaxID=1618747 RepID=A0A0G1HFT9_9BACT|nr:MAG: Cysteine desulfurase [Candidatus Nomurabacteria bacterium GW2011_GWB1_43_7]